MIIDIKNLYILPHVWSKGVLRNKIKNRYLKNKNLYVEIDIDIKYEK